MANAVRATADEGPVLFYERRFYCFSNFSAFAVRWRDELWMTSEHAYQAAKFEDAALRAQVRQALSAHDAKVIAHEFDRFKFAHWHEARMPIMLGILRAKLNQHDFVRRRLIETGDREIVEDSPKDAYWGWGPDQQGENRLGKLWMRLRSEIRSSTA